MEHPRPSCAAKRCPEHLDERETLLDEATPALLRRLADEIERQQEAEEQRRLTGNRGTDAEKRKLLKAILLFHGVMGGGGLLIVFGFFRLVLCSLVVAIAVSFL